MKKLILAALMLCIVFTACGKKAAEDKAVSDTSYSQSVSIEYDLDRDFGDMLVKLLNSVAIKQKIGMDPSEVNHISVVREPQKEKPAENGHYNNVIRVTADAGDKNLSKELFDTFYNKANAGIEILIKGNNITIEKVD